MSAYCTLPQPNYLQNNKPYFLCEDFWRLHGVGCRVGALDGLIVGDCDGASVGAVVGYKVGLGVVGAFVGPVAKATKSAMILITLPD